MNDDAPDILFRLTPRGAPAELRSRVLEAAGHELGTSCPRPTPRWERWLQMAVAASFVVGLALNWAQTRADRDLQSRLFGPPPVPSGITEVTRAVESVTDAETGQWIENRLMAMRSPRRNSQMSGGERYERLLDELTNTHIASTL